MIEKMKKILLQITMLVAALFFSVAGLRASDNSGKVINLTKGEFLKLVYDYENNPESLKYLGDKPAIIDFYADWCRPCKQVAPILEELAKEYKGQIYIYKVNTDNERELAQAFGITSIPTLIFIPQTGAPQVSQGALPKDILKSTIETVLLGK